MTPQNASRPVTIADVARTAGVSRATVSRVVNGLATVDRDIAVRVEKAIAELNYRPSETARNLSLGRTNTVAVVVPDLGNPMFQAILRGVTRAADDDGYRVLVADTQERPGREMDAAIEARRRCDALVLCAPRMADDRLAEVISAARPLALVNRSFADDSVPQVSIDYARAIELVLDHLVELGHKKVIYLGGPAQSASNRLRLIGLDRAEASHPELSIERIQVGSSLDDGWNVATTILDGNATAVVAFNDLVALGLLSRLRELGVPVPERLSVVGVDDIPFARFGLPALTTVAVPQEALGINAWERLRRTMAGEAPGDPLWLHGSLELRRSTGPAPS